MIAASIAEADMPQSCIAIAIAAPTERSSARIATLIARIAAGVRHTVCGVRGHLWVLHYAPGHLSLRCFACGAETPGWTVDVRP